MSSRKSNRKRKVKKSRKIFNSILFLFLTIVLMIGGVAGGLVYTSIKDLPSINPYGVLNELNLNSHIYDEDGNLVEKIRAEENRTIVPLDQIPENLQNAIVAIEDERFWEHSGVDLKSISGSLLENIRAKEVVRGASTITQQLAKNVYLSNEVKITRKIKEAYIAIQLEKSLSKEEILEAYLNSVYFGQGAYGVQEASETYFSKDVSELTLAESAVVAGITNSPSNLSPYILKVPEDVSGEDMVLGEVSVLGEPYFAVFNGKSLERQKLILSKMRSLGYIAAIEYDEALTEDISAALVPGRVSHNADISSYFVDYVKDQVVEDLVKKAGYTEEAAHRELYTGGISVYSTVDLELQKGVEDIYKNFSSYVSSGKMSSWNVDGAGNIVSSSGSSDIVFYGKNNILDTSGNLRLSRDEFTTESDGSVSIKSQKISPSSKSLDIADYYTTDTDGNLLTHSLGSLSLSSDKYRVASDGTVTISSSFLNEARNFNMSESGDELLIGNSYFSNDEEGVMQPQSATVILEQSSGKIVSLVGGRNMTGQRILNRALVPRQTGSSMKPLGAYLPALDNGYTAATPIDDVPYYNEKGELWPRNYDGRYRGLVTLRDSVELSINTNSVKTVEKVGIQTSMKYLEKMGIIKGGKADSFVTRQEDRDHNDENLAALGLGGLSKGISPLDMAGAYGSIANGGTYIAPRSYSRVEDKNGNIILDNTPSKTKVVSPETAFIMTDILRTTVSDGLSIAKKARIDPGNSSIPVAGKTGTTNDNSDVWFVGYTPYYTGSVWMGNDSMNIKLSQDSGMASQIFSTVMKLAHDGLSPKNFDRPENIVEREICTASGKLVGPVCSSDSLHKTRKELFVKGTEPIEECDVHVLLKVDLSTGKLATSGCPKALLMERFFLKRPIAYDPAENDNIYPEDYIYAPPDICHHSGRPEPEEPIPPRENRPRNPVPEVDDERDSSPEEPEESVSPDMPNQDENSDDADDESLDEMTPAIPEQDDGELGI